MSERISACENICRDFWSIWSLSPEVVAALLTFAAALVASGTAIWIAVHVYRIQKQIDRDHAVLEERRKAYLAMLNQLNDFTAAIVEQDWDRANELHRGLHAKGTYFLCFATKDAAQRFREYTNAVQAFYPTESDYSESDNNEALGRQSMRLLHEVLDAREAAIVQVRKDLFLSYEGSEEDVVRAFFPDAHDSERYSEEGASR